MGLGDLFKLEKLTILAFKDRARQPPGLGRFEAMFNPESFTQKYEILYSKHQGMDSSGKPLNYAYSKPADLNLRLVLDGTGVSSMGLAQLLPQTPVAQRIKDFLALAFEMNGDIHEPNYLLAKWGDFEFRCRLGSVDVQYTQFDRDGSPLRATLNIKLVSDESLDDLAKKEAKKSPDVSHSRLVRTGDTLPLLCKEVYGSSAHYLWVAQANGLDGFRRLQPGTSLVFPPLPTAGGR